ncbi:hypothetical protein F4778DRAFT_375638 [Xylariomycetidae sp. FL2044]|nr:hypothetical protein F4778DRAFT_375638 [Xylariomycetidae sp. FL2044]
MVTVSWLSLIRQCCLSLASALDSSHPPDSSHLQRYPALSSCSAQKGPLTIAVRDLEHGFIAIPPRPDHHAALKLAFLPIPGLRLLRRLGALAVKVVFLLMSVVNTRKVLMPCP